MNKPCINCGHAEWGPDGCYCHAGSKITPMYDVEECDMQAKEVNNDPSSTTINKEANWIVNNEGDWNCSNCHAIVEKLEQCNHNWLYCYHCGSYMKNWDSVWV